MFQAAAITSDLLETLGRDGHFTLFAPTNEAFEKLPRGVLERIMGDKVASEGRKMSSSHGDLGWGQWEKNSYGR